MKLLFILVATIHICQAITDNSSNFTSQVNELRSSFLKAVKEGCYKNCTESYYRFINVTENTTKCLETVIGQTSVFLTSLKTYKDNIQSCVDEFVEELENCLPENSKDFPQLNFDILYSFLDFLHENKEELFAPEVASFVKNCTETFNQNDTTSDFKDCFKFFLTDNLEIKAFCQEMIEVERCIVIELNRKCPAPDSIEKLKDGLLTALREPCAEFDVTDNPLDNVFTLMAPYEPPNMNPDLL